MLALAVGAAYVAWETLRRPEVERALRAAERAALAASAHDEHFDPIAVITAAHRRYAAVGGRTRGDDIAAIEQLFGHGALGRVLTLNADVGEAAAPGRIRLRMLRPRMRVAALDLDRDGEVASVKVRAEAGVRTWLGNLGYWPARIFSAAMVMTALVMEEPPVPMARSARLVSFWVFEREGMGWTLVRVEPGESGAHRLKADPTGEGRLMGRLHDEAVRELVEPPEELAIPEEIATNLPTDPDAALRDLMLVDDRFTPSAIDLAVRDVVGRWEEATAGDHRWLEEIAEPAVIEALLARDRVVRGAHVRELRVTRVWALRIPPELDVELVVHAWRGRRGHAEGAESDQRQWWRLAATTSPQLPWRVVEVGLQPLDAARPRAPHHGFGPGPRGTS